MPAEWIKSLAARFFVFDGPDGSGKSTQLRRLAEYCRESGIDVATVRDPGGTAIGEQIRAILLDPANEDMSVRTETLLYMASRAQLVHDEILPALKAGRLVLADRFISSTLAYQGAAGGLSSEEIMAAASTAIGSCRPDLTIIFDVDQLTAHERTRGGTGGRKRRAPSPTLFDDRVERKDADFHERVRLGFLQQAQENPDTYLVIDARASVDDVFTVLLEQLERHVCANG